MVEALLTHDASRDMATTKEDEGIPAGSTALSVADHQGHSDGGAPPLIVLRAHTL